MNEGKIMPKLSIALKFGLCVECTTFIKKPYVNKL